MERNHLDILVEDFRVELVNRYASNLNLQMCYVDSGILYGDQIRIKHKNRGTGTEVIEQLISFAAAHSLTFVFEPKADEPVLQWDLEALYTRLGFVPNVGKDFNPAYVVESNPNCWYYR